MQIEVKETEYCKLDVQYEVGIEQIENKKNEVLTFFKKAPVPGFRPGKANIEVIKIHYRKQIDDAVKRALAEEAFHNTIFEKKIKPFGAPDFKNILLLNNKFSCSFSMQKKPDFEVAPYKNLEFPKQTIDFTTTELVQKMLEELRYRYGESIPYQENDFVQMGDNIIIDYKAFDTSDPNNEIELTSLGATGELMTVGKGQFLEFDNSVLGMKLGEERTFALKIPDNGLPSVAGKMIKFVVNIMIGSKVHPVPLNDELALKINKKDFQELETYITGMATAKVTEAQKAAQINQISSKLIDDNDVEIPHWLSLSEAQYLASSAQLEWEVLPDEDKVKYLSMAERNVKLALILDKIRENEPEAQISDEEVLTSIRDILGKTNANPDDVLKNINQNGYLAVLTARMRDEHTLDFILKNSTILE